MEICSKTARNSTRFASMPAVQAFFSGKRKPSPFGAGQVMRFSRPGFLAFLLIGTVALSASLLAHSGATGVVKERMDSMSSMATAMKTIADMIKEKVPFDETEVRRSSNTLYVHAKTIPILFPDSVMSRKGDSTRAHPSVWKRWEAFVAIAARLEIESGSLGAAAAGGDRSAVVSGFVRAAKACRDCHVAFRRP